MLKEQEQCFLDVGLRSAVKHVLYDSYNWPWLALGLELVTGRTYDQRLKADQKYAFGFIENVSMFPRTMLTGNSSYSIISALHARWKMTCHGIT
jgi:hypothetical protein